MSKICKTCRHWNEIDKSHFVKYKVGECRRYAPRHIHGIGAMKNSQKFPMMHIESWCGEWKTRIKAVELGAWARIYKIDIVKFLDKHPMPARIKNCLFSYVYHQQANANRGYNITKDTFYEMLLEAKVTGNLPINNIGVKATKVLLDACFGDDNA